MQVDDHESVSLQRFARHCLAPTPPKQHDLAASIAELRQIADGHDEVLAEAAGITAGSWYAWPATHAGHELVAAGLLIMAGGHEGRPLDFEALERWTRVGFERGTRFRKGER
jgi:hypothetical protein